MLASWYIPRALTPWPAHIPRVSPQQLADGCGPDKGGGMAWGAPFDQAGDWICAAAGFWFDRATITPGRTLRANARPGRVAAGFLVPHAINLDQSSVVGFWSESGWEVPAPWDDLVVRLRPTRDYYGPVTADHAKLAADLIGLNYHVSLAELGALQVLTPQAINDVIGAAWGISQEELDATLESLRQRVAEPL
jgi:hypothetical protein